MSAVSSRIALAAVVAVAAIAVGGVAGATTAPPDDSSGPSASAPADTDSGGLVGTWNVATIGADDVSGIGAFFEFTDDGQVQGFSGVNSFHGPYEAGQGTIEFGAVISTRMAGPEPAMAVENALFAVLEGAQPVALAGDMLTLGSGDGAVELHRVMPEAADAIVTISGTATYLERIALPDGAVVTVQVSDVSLADAPATVVAEATIVPTHQVPIPYAIAVSSSSFEEGHRYSLSIRISVGDELLFTTTEHLAVTAEPVIQTFDVVLSGAGS